MDYTLLTNSPLFKGMTSDDIELIFSSLNYRIKMFEPGSLVCLSGEPVNSLLIVLNGVVKGEMVDFSGRVIKIEDVPAPGAVAPAFIFGKRNRFPVNVVAVSAVKLLYIDKPDFLVLLKKNENVLVNFMDLISNRSQFLSEKIRFLRFKTIKGKLAHYILQTAGIEQTSVILGMTQSDLADFFGVARPSVTRALSELESEGYIEAIGKKIKILDREGLEELTII